MNNNNVPICNMDESSNKNKIGTAVLRSDEYCWLKRS